jgi:hypothetical protein
MTEN